MGGNIDNPVGQMLFGDSATTFRASIRQKELIRPPIACGSCSVDPHTTVQACPFSSEEGGGDSGQSWQLAGWGEHRAAPSGERTLSYPNSILDRVTDCSLAHFAEEMARRNAAFQLTHFSSICAKGSNEGPHSAPITSGFRGCNLLAPFKKKEAVQPSVQGP